MAGQGLSVKWGGLEGAVTYDEEANEEDGRESTSTGVDGEPPNKIGEGGRERIGIVFGDDVA
jgi:hypothetical protein